MLQIIDHYPLSKVTTLQIGGPAKKFVTVKTQKQLLEALVYAQNHQIPSLVIGGGSNLLVSDAGVDSLVIKNEISGMAATHLRGAILKVESGTPLQKLVDYTIQHGLSGLEKLTGIPGTVGGAIYGNAGAYGQTISDHISNVVTLACPESTDSGVPRRGGVPRMTVNKKGCDFDYRDSVFKKTHDIILEVTFLLNQGDPKTLQKEAQEVLSKRLVKYPPGIKCPGSFFKNLIAAKLPAEILKNIPADKIMYGKLPAGSLLEEVGAKGQKVDGIEIAHYHANLFINQGAGTALAFYNLAQKYALKVKEKYGIFLEPEVQLVNLPPI